MSMGCLRWVYTLLQGVQEGVTSQAVPLRRTRCAWNKGMTVPEATRLKISQAQKRRWRDPGLRLRARITAAQQVDPPEHVGSPNKTPLCCCWSI